MHWAAPFWFVPPSGTHKTATRQKRPSRSRRRIERRTLSLALFARRSACVRRQRSQSSAITKLEGHMVSDIKQPRRECGCSLVPAGGLLVGTHCLTARQVAAQRNLTECPAVYGSVLNQASTSFLASSSARL
jgi:hypothetical protein